MLGKISNDGVGINIKISIIVALRSVAAKPWTSLGLPGVLLTVVPYKYPEMFWVVHGLPHSHFSIIWT